MFGYIYKTTNLINNKIYIGQKKSTEFISSYYGSGKLLVKALRKYGKENFKVEVICWCESKQKLDEEERYWIHRLNSKNNLIGYNLAEGGEGSNGGGFTGKCHSKETKKRISESMKNDNRLRKSLGWVAFKNSPANKKGHVAKNKGKKRIWKDNKYKYVLENEIVYYIEQGWIQK